MDTANDWGALFAPLGALEGPAGQAIRAGLRQVTVPAGTTLVRQGDVCTNYLLAIAGSIKVFSRAENGRELVLYRIEPGGSCTLTTACLFSHSRFPAEAVAETAVTALLLPAPLFQRGMAESDSFRRFVFDAYGQRVADLILLVEQVAFSRIDMRLARYLLERASGELDATHQSIAAELGTAREVISRQLKEFEQQGWLELGRGRIRVTDRDALRAIAVPN